MISANERFFGGCADDVATVATGLLTSGLVGKGLLRFAVDATELVFAVVASSRDGAGCARGAGGRTVDTGLSLDVFNGRSAGRRDGFEDDAPFGRDDPFVTDSMRAVFVVALRSSSSALRLGTARVGLVAAAGDGEGFSPVIEASKSEICDES